MDNFMKIGIALGLCAVLSASFISVRAADTPAQAAARVALERMLNPSDDSQTRSLPATNTLSQAVVEQPGKSAATVTETVPEKAVTTQTTPGATTPVAAPAAVAPAAVSPAAASATVSHVIVVPAAVSPATVAPTMSFLILWLLFLSLLLILFVIVLVLLLKLRALKLQLLKHPNVMASSKIQPAAAKKSPSTEQRGSRIKS
jgi:hypothetical protein